MFFYFIEKNNTFERMLDNNEEHVEELVWYNEAAVFDLEMDDNVEELHHRASVITRMNSDDVAERDYKEKHLTVKMRNKKDNAKLREENIKGVVFTGSDDSGDTGNDSAVDVGSDCEGLLETTIIKGFRVSNYSNPKEASSLGKEPPAYYISDKFKPTVVSLNNQVNFFATMGSTMINNKARMKCDLHPVCQMSFSERTVVGTVMVPGDEDHPRAGKISLVCAHHSAASGKGVKLQTQKRLRNYSVKKDCEQAAKKQRFEKIKILKKKFNKNKLAP